jgi:hypothetical protein
MRRTLAIALALVAMPLAAPAQGFPDSAALLAAQRSAMAALASMDGVWRGPAWTLLPSGEKREMTQTERIGPMLGGSIKVIEGRSYSADGSSGFNAFAIVAFDPASKRYTLHSHAQGHAGTFSLTPTATGYAWEIPAGPATIRYTVTITGNDWVEVGDRVMPDKEPQRFFEMRLKRIGDTTWPAGDPVAPK